MAQTIKLKRSAQSGASGIPSTSDLALGEVGINTYHGKMYIKKDDGTESIVEVGSTGSFLPLSGGTLTGNLSLGDNVKAQFGASDDLQIYHDGSNSFISDTGTGGLNIRGSDFVKLQTSDGAETMLFAQANGTVQLKYDNSTKLATTSTGISISNDANFPDNGKAIFGAGDDLQIYHDPNHSIINESGTGSLKIQGDNIRLQKTDGSENMITAVNDGAVTLFYDNAEKLATTSTGTLTTGTSVVSTSMMIGSTDSPSRDLEIKTTNPHIRLTDTDASGSYTEIFGGSGITTINADKGQNVTGSVLKLSVDATDGITINSNHNVSIPNGDLDVNGSVTADGLTVDGTINAYRSGYTQGIQLLGDSGGNQVIGTATNDKSLIIKNLAATKGIEFVTTNKSLDIANNGDISFYNDSAAQGLFWDSSASCLGIGTTNPSSYYAKNLVVSAPSEGGLTIASTATSHTNYILFADGTSGDSAYRGQIAYNHNNDLMNVISSGSMDFRTGSSRDIRLTINSDGSSEFSGAVTSTGLTVNVNDSTTFTSTSRANGFLQINNTNTTSGVFSGIELIATGTGSAGAAEIFCVDSGSGSGDLVFSTRNIGTWGEKLRINADGSSVFSGSVGIGVTPSAWGDTSTALQIGSLALEDYTVSGANVSVFYNNAFRNTSGNIVYKETDFASTYSQYNGEHTFSIAPSGTAGATISLTQALKISSSANVNIPNGSLMVGSTTAPDTALHVESANDTVGIFESTDATSKIQFKDNSSTYGASIGTTDENFFIQANGGTRLTINSSGNVGIGTSSPSAEVPLTAVYNSTSQFHFGGVQSGISNNTYYNGSAWVNRNASVGGSIFQMNTSGEFNFRRAGTGANPTVSYSMTLTSGGDLLVGGTSAYAQSATTIANGGILYVSRSGGGPATFRRNSDDGSIITLEKDGTTVGSIGTNGGDLFVGTGDTNILFADGSDKIMPATTGGATRDAAIDLGTTGGRFKDLHLSGTANVGGVLELKSNNSGFPTSGMVLNQNNFVYLRGGSNGLIMGKAGDNEAMRIDSSGRVGIGTGTVTAKITLADHTTAAGGIKFRSASNSVSLWSSGSGNLNSDATFNTTGRIRLVGGQAASDPDIHFTGAASGTGFSRAANDITFITAASEAARLTSGGTLLVGTTGGATYQSTVNEGVEIAPDFIGVARNQNTVMHLNRQGNDGTIVDFRTYGFVRGSVSISGSTTSYNTSSDERLKENIKDSDDSGSKVDAIQVRQFDWKADGEHQDYGMVAQELLEVAPDAVTQGDTPDDMMGVDYSKLVPMLIKEIQSLRQRVAQLEE